jgi:twitching motility two-component system response regulator PilH
MSATVLVADDSQTIRQIVQMALKASPYSLVSAASGREVMEALQRRPDVIVLDYYMPDVNGYDLCRQLKTNPATQGIAVVMMGGSYRNFDENLARQAGADAVVFKPFKTDQLLGALEQALAKRGGASAAAPPNPFAPKPSGLPTPPSAPGLPQRPGLPAAPAAAQPTAPSRPIPQSPITGPQASVSPVVPTAQRLPPTPQPAPSPANSGSTALRQSTSQPRIEPSQRPYSSGNSGVAGAGVDRAQIEELVREVVREEIQRMVRGELPNLLRNLMGDVFVQKVLPRLTQHADEKLQSVMNDQLDARIDRQVRQVLDQLLAEE